MKLDFQYHDAFNHFHFPSLLFNLHQRRTYIPQGLTIEMPLSQMPEEGATDYGSEH